MCAFALMRRASRKLMGSKGASLEPHPKRRGAFSHSVAVVPLCCRSDSGVCRVLLKRHWAAEEHTLRQEASTDHARDGV